MTLSGRARGAAFVEADCRPGGGAPSCTCSIDDAIVGTCDGAADSPWSGCDLWIGCCSQFWQCRGRPAPPVEAVCGYLPDGECTCTLSGGVAIETRCTPDSAGALRCTCARDGATVGTCSPDASQTCVAPIGSEVTASDPLFGCCAEFW